jgi:hypothetical protein
VPRLTDVEVPLLADVDVPLLTVDEPLLTVDELFFDEPVVVVTLPREVDDEP